MRETDGGGGCVYMGMGVYGKISVLLWTQNYPKN